MDITWKDFSGEGTVGRGEYRTYYTGHMEKIKGEGKNSIGNVEAKEFIWTWT